LRTEETRNLNISFGESSRFSARRMSRKYEEKAPRFSARGKSSICCESFEPDDRCNEENSNDDRADKQRRDDTHNRIETVP